MKILLSVFFLCCYYEINENDFSNLLPIIISIVILLFNAVMIMIMLIDIKENKKSSNKVIEEIKNTERKRILANLLNLRKELESNHSLMLLSISNESYKKGESMGMDSFKVTSFMQGTATNCLTDEKLIKTIYGIYDGLLVINNYIKMGIETELRFLLLPVKDKWMINEKKIIARYNSKIIEICEDLHDECVKVIKELHKVESNI